jgi:hypothetical protein
VGARVAVCAGAGNDTGSQHDGAAEHPRDAHAHVTCQDAPRLLS